MQNKKRKGEGKIRRGKEEETKKKRKGDKNKRKRKREESFNPQTCTIHPVRLIGASRPNRPAPESRRCASTW